MQTATTWTLPELPAGVVIWNNADLEGGLAKIADQALAIQAAADADGRALTEAEVREITDLDNNFRALEARIASHNKAEESIAHMTRTGRGRLTSPDGPGQSEGRYSNRASLDSVIDPAQLRNLQRTPFKGRSYVEMFGQPQERNPFPNVDEFLDLVVHNRFDPRLIRNTSMSEGEDSSGGYLVPPHFAVRWLDSALEQTILWGRVRLEPMTSRSKDVASFANSDNSTSAPYGFSLQWLSESGTYSEQKGKTRKITLYANKAGIYVPYSMELGEDGGEPFATQLQTALISSLSWGLDDVVLRGNGAGKPLGILSSPALITVNKESGQIADALTYQNVIDVYSRMLPSSMSNAIWITNPTCLPQLLTMSMFFGSGSMVWAPALTQNGTGYSLLGRPVYLSEKASAIGDLGDLLFIDPSRYVAGIRKDISIAISQHVKFNTDELVVKVTVRVAGQPEVDTPFTPAHGVTLSPFVTLQAR